MERGTVWWAELPKPVASEPGFRRPVIVVQAHSFNRSRIKTIMVVVLTRNQRLADAPGNVCLPASVTGLPKDSVANVSQVITVDKKVLVEQCERIPSQLMKAIDDGLRLSLSLIPRPTVSLDSDLRHLSGGDPGARIGGRGVVLSSSL